MRASGIAVSNVGRDMRRIDISVPGAQGFSVKGSFTKGAEIRLINVLGKGVGGGWQEATIFVLTKIGIAYADPEVLPDAASPRGDAIVLKRRKLEEFLRGNDGYLIQCDIAPKSADTENTKVASEAVAKDLLNEFRTLK